VQLLDRGRTVAPAIYNRCLVSPAALAVHLSIGAGLTRIGLGPDISSVSTLINGSPTVPGERSGHHGLRREASVVENGDTETIDLTIGGDSQQRSHSGLPNSS
jgi:hypothetical protein